MTLFDLIEPNGVFAEVLDVFYGGKSRMLEVRGQQVLLDRDAATVYGLETKRVLEAVRNNPDAEKLLHDW